MPARQTIVQHLGVLLLAVACVFVLDLITVEYEAAYLRGDSDEQTIFQGDQSDYVKLAQDAGISDGDVLGPFAYRIIPAMVAWGLAQITSGNVVDGYHIMTWIGLVLQLWLCFVLARELGANLWQALFVMGIVALTFGNVRYMTYDYIRPDAIVYPWLLVVVILILRGRLRWAMLLTWPGVIAREYFLLPAGIISVYFLWQAWGIYRNPDDKTPLWQPLGWAALSSLGAILVFWIPRLLIAVPGTYQFIETTDQGGLLEGLWFTLTSGGRNRNYVMAFFGYMFPSALLFSWYRWQSMQDDFRRVAALVLLYGFGVMALSYIGGLDFIRFTSYMVIVQVILLTLLLKHRVFWWELVYLMVLWVWYNRVFEAMPGLQADMNGYLIFVSPWGMSVPQEISNRFELATLLIFILWGIRMVVMMMERRTRHATPAA